MFARSKLAGLVARKAVFAWLANDVDTKVDRERERGTAEAPGEVGVEGLEVNHVKKGTTIGIRIARFKTGETKFAK